MQVRNFELQAQHAELMPELTEAFRTVVEQCHFINGDNCKNLESQIATLCGNNHGLGLNSGTDALLMALLALGVGPGDEVITTPFTFVATAETICLAGATPVFADIDLQTFNLDPESVRAKVTPKTKAMLPVHLFGLPADMDAFQNIKAEHGIPIVADGAQSIGAEYDGKPLGQWSDLLTLSFYPTKNLGACGDGGMVLTNSGDQAEHIRLLRSHGAGGTYVYKEIGYCSRLDELQAAIVRIKLNKLEEWNEKRRANAAFYDTNLASLSDHIVLPHASEKCSHVYHQYTIRVADGKRDALKKHLESKGVFPAVFYPGALHLEAAYEYLGYTRGELPNSERATEQVLSIPVHPYLNQDQRALVASALQSFYQL